MTTAHTTTTGNSLRLWLFRALVVVGAALMLASWFMPWWSARISDLAGRDHIILRPWGVEMVNDVRTYADKSLYSMPAFFEPLMWLYIGLCMLALAVSLFAERRVAIGRLNLSLPRLLVGFVGLSYVIAVATAFAIAQIRSGAAGIQFVGTSTVFNPMTGGNTRIIGELLPGYWLAAGAGAYLIVLAILRNAITGRARPQQLS
jgi:hypothetical protein